jgi:hypothetical protein
MGHISFKAGSPHAAEISSSYVKVVTGSSQTDDDALPTLLNGINTTIATNSIVTTIRKHFL